MKKGAIPALFVCFLLGVHAPPALSAGFPEKPITLVVGFAAGGSDDVEARGLAPFLQKHLDTRILVENLPGANGSIGRTKVWKAKPDGYTILVHVATTTLISQYLAPREYRPLEFSHIFSWTTSYQVVAVNSETYKNFNDFVKDAKTRTLSASIPVLGSTAHLSGLMLADGLGIKVNWVPFDGAGEALTALAGKHVDFAVTDRVSAVSLARAGKIRPLVVTANQKDIVFPDVPLAKDLGFNFPVLSLRRGADAPPNTALSIIKILEAAFAKVVKEPEYINWAKNRMSGIEPLGHEAYGKALLEQQREIEKYKSVLAQIKSK